MREKKRENYFHAARGVYIFRKQIESIKNKAEHSVIGAEHWLADISYRALTSNALLPRKI